VTGGKNNIAPYTNVSQTDNTNHITAFLLFYYRPKRLIVLNWA